MMPRASAWLAWLLAALTVAMFLASAALYVLTRSAQSPGNWVTGGTVSELLGFAPFLAFPIVGALIASRRPHNSIGWICLADGLLWSLLGMTDYYSRYGMAQPGSVPFPVAITAALKASGCGCHPWACSASTCSYCSPTGSSPLGDGALWPGFRGR